MLQYCGRVAFLNPLMTPMPRSSNVGGSDCQLDKTSDHLGDRALGASVRGIGSLAVESSTLTAGGTTPRAGIPGWTKKKTVLSRIMHFSAS